METPDFEHGRVYFKQFGAERVKQFYNSGMIIRSLGRGTLNILFLLNLWDDSIKASAVVEW